MRKGYKVTVSINKKPLKKLKKLKFKKLGKDKNTQEVRNVSKKAKSSNSKNRRKGSTNNKNSDQNLTRGIDIVNNYKDKEEEIRQERIGKTLVEIHNELLDIEKEKLLKRRARRRRAFIILILVLLILAYIFFTYGPIVGISIYKNEQVDEKRKIDITSTEEDVYLNYCDELLVYNNRKITTYNSSLRKTWEYELQEIFTPSIYVNKNYLVVANKTNGTVYLFQNKKELLTKRIDGNIAHVYISDNGEFAVEYSTSGYKKVIGVYSKNGKLLYNTYLNEKSIIDIKFIEGPNKLLLIASDSSSFNIGTTLSIIDGTKKENNITEIAKLDNNLVYDCTIQKKNAILLLDNKIVNCNLSTGSVSDVKQFETSQVLFASLSNNYYTSVEKDLGQKVQDYMIRTLRFDNSQISQTNAKNSPKMFENSGYLNYFIYQDKLQVINKWGVELKNIDITFPPKNIVIFNKEKCVALIYSNKIYFVNM